MGGKMKLFLVVLTMAAVLANSAYGEVELVKDPTKILVGDPICSDIEVSKDKSWVSLIYYYKGKVQDTLKIQRKVEVSGARGATVFEDELIELPINEKRQALLQAKDAHYKSSLLILTVVDDFGSIKVEESK